eukprot:scaffold2.g6828.t1
MGVRERRRQRLPPPPPARACSRACLRRCVRAVPQVVGQKEMLHSLLEDVALLSGLGVKLVVVVGVRMQINQAVRARGREPCYASGYRVTDPETMQAAIAAAGRARMEVEARLSKGPAVTMTVAANYVAAKRKGVVNGVDYQLTGVVRFVQSDAIRRQLDGGAVVMLSNLGYSVAGEVLNCDIYTVATRAAMDLQARSAAASADKLIIMTLPSNQPLSLPHWLPLSEAQALLRDVAAARAGQAATARPGGGAGGGGSGGGGAASAQATAGAVAAAAEAAAAEAAVAAAPVGEVDFDRWYESGLPLPLLAACTAAGAGVKRAHLVDARVDGGLLLELYSRDGVGTMISTDFYEGIRAAGPQDLGPIQLLLRPLEDKGILVKRSAEQLLADLPHFTVVEREARVLGCAMVKPLGANAAGQEVGELAAFCVHPTFRGSGKGDSLLEYLVVLFSTCATPPAHPELIHRALNNPPASAPEADARRRGIQRLVLLTTRTADWFQQRGFAAAGPAHSSPLLPAARRDRIDAARNSQLYSKELELE